jgi:hypothetical protein
MPKSDPGTRTQIQQALADHVGIEFARTRSATSPPTWCWKENPGAHGLVQCLLGHNSLHATMTFYSGLEADAAIKHHDALIARHRQAPPLVSPSRARAVR